ncbi:hypothetical protein [Novosphingobium resinovorum]|nr:hypothetical protein [Novosphingobium resinovorum]
MKHDFTPDPEVHVADAARMGTPVELVLIVAIFVAVWLAFGAQLLAEGLH